MDRLRQSAAACRHALLAASVVLHRVAQHLSAVTSGITVPRESSNWPLRSLLEHRAEHPAVAVEVGKLGVLQLALNCSVPGSLQELRVRPQPADRAAFGIALLDGGALGVGAYACLARVHLVPVGLVVPPRQPLVGRDHVGAGVHVADHALAGGDRAGQHVLDGMPGFVLGNHRIGGLRSRRRCLPAQAAGVDAATDRWRTAHDTPCIRYCGSRPRDHWCP